MTDIELPCCETTIQVEALTDTIRCDRCGIELDIADDEPAPVPLAA
jgi:hypothetical protein